ncbi:MAG: hypothetical protein M1526_00730 [Candidatus Thermoplasmatota archaeon]|jgi:hypothetical protein|nr:hypothetical protein [Candidatus Thermoplasmatota archaeon]
MDEIMLNSVQFGEGIAVTIIYIIVLIYLQTIDDGFSDKQYGLILASIVISFSVLMGVIAWSVSTFIYFLGLISLGAFIVAIGRRRRYK